MECSLALGTMSSGLLAFLVLGLVLQTSAFESPRTRMIRIFKRSGLASNDDLVHGDKMSEYPLGRFHRVLRGQWESGENRNVEGFLHKNEDRKMSIRRMKHFLTRL